MNAIALWYRMTAHVEVHPHQAAAAAVHNRPAAAARYNYGYIDDDDDREDVVPERHRDWQQTKPNFTSRPGNDVLEDMMPPKFQNLAPADPYRRPASGAGKPLSVISRNLGSTAQTACARPGVGVYPADVHFFQTDTDV